MEVYLVVIRLSSSTLGESFTVITSTGGSKTATLSREFPPGTYLIESKANDTNLEIYLGGLDEEQVGIAPAGAKTITASAPFLYVTTVNADTNDAVIFTLKSASTLVNKTDAVWAPPTITDITPSGLPNVNDTTTITGTNFAENVNIKFRKSDDATLVNAKSTVRGSATSIIATRPDTFAVGDAPYDVIVTNPSTNLTATSLNAITAGAVPVWVTSTTLNEAIIDTEFSQTISATDADGGSSITYAIVSGAFPTGLSLNTSTGAISGTPTGSVGTYTVTISATDSGLNTVNRTFTQFLNLPEINVDYLVVAGGGGGGGFRACVANGGGGAGGYRELTLNGIKFSTNYLVTVGAGGAPGSDSANGTNGVNSIFSSITSAGGGGGASGSNTGSSGGSGGGGCNFGTGGQGNTPTTSPSQGNDGGTATGNGAGGGGGSSAVGANASGNNGGNGGAGTASSITGSSVTRAGGGGGGSMSSTAGTGGSGGGGNGSNSTATAASGSVNTGGGGGGGGGTSGTCTNGAGGAGGSGVVILKYPDFYTITIGAGLTGSTAAPSGGFKVTTITAGTGNVSWV
jgi:hypothetical protein